MLRKCHGLNVCVLSPAPTKIHCLSSDTQCIWRWGFREAKRFRWGHGGLKLNTQKTKIMASIPITSWDSADFIFSSVQFSSVQSLSRVRLFATPWTATRQASLSITNSKSLPKPCPLSQWCHPAISSSAVPFSSYPQSLPASKSFPMSQLFPWGGQSIDSISISPSN